MTTCALMETLTQSPPLQNILCWQKAPLLGLQIKVTSSRCRQPGVRSDLHVGGNVLVC